MELSIVIPAYNEARRLPATLRGVEAYLRSSGRRAEVLVVDDGSTDGTTQAARVDDGYPAPVRLVALPRNRGKGAAVRTGLLAAEGERILVMDADQSTPIGEVERLLPALDAGSGIAIGSRYLVKGSITIRQPWYRVAISRLGNGLVRAVVLPGIEDSQCGFKLFTREAARAVAGRLTMDGFSYDIELLVVARRLGIPIASVPVTWADTPGTRFRPLWSSFQTLRDLVAIRRRLGRAPAP